jgi:hypothetical protein
MRLTRLVSGTVIGVIGLSAWACSKSASTAPTGGFTEAQAGQLFSELAAVSASISTVGFERAASTSGGVLLPIFSRPAFDIQSSISVSGNCPAGGTVSISGNVNPTASSVTFDFTDTWSSCKTADYLTNGSTTENGNFSYTTGSSPTISGTLTETGTLSGTALSGGSSFTCSLNVTLTVSGTSSSPSASWSGTMCGVAVSGTI